MGYAPENKSCMLVLTYNYGVTEYDKVHAYAQMTIIKLRKQLNFSVAVLPKTLDDYLISRLNLQHVWNPMVGIRFRLKAVIVIHTMAFTTDSSSVKTVPPICKSVYGQKVYSNTLADFDLYLENLYLESLA